MTTRWAAGVEYAGTRYVGWQAQENLRSVQAEVERALSVVAAHPVQVVAAGRTDTGVHALQQVVHWDSAAARRPYAWLLGTNANLPDDVSLRWVQTVEPSFHARHSATARSYRYVVHNARSRSALLADRAAWWTYPLDEQAMQRAAQVLVGKHDFSAFRASGCQSATALRCVHELQITRRGDFVVLDITANAFLHHMVRNIAGVLLHIGQGRQPESWCAELLGGRDRTLGGVTAPACGLYFIGPQYPEPFALPKPPKPWFPA